MDTTRDEVIELEQVSDAGHPSVASARELLSAYGNYIATASGSSEVLAVQGFDAELAGLPGAYASPQGVLLLARINGSPAGTVALRPVEPGVVELKRLYVDPAFRGRSLGRKLVQEALDRASSLQAHHVVLDTMPFMQTAARMYRDLGFQPAPEYLARHAPGARCMVLELEVPRPQAEMQRYRAEWRGDFERLNREWLEEFFRVEAPDLHYFADPDATIRSLGGEIFFVVEQGTPVGTCAVIRHDDGRYELAKMAVQRHSRGKGYGQWLVTEALAYARDAGAKQLYLLSDEKLPDALRLYERMGFVRRPWPGSSGYERGNVYMEQDLSAR